jgi:pimeloyl-ACP methyl ester carboxylesterase
MPTLTLDKRRLFYADHRPDRPGPALLLLHGAGGSHLIWPGALRGLVETRVLALDLPGHGRSDPPGRRTIGQYAAVVEAFMAALGLPEVVVAGHSMGGAIALTMALEPARALRGIVLIGAGARMPVGGPLLGGALASLERASDFVVDNGFVEAPPDLRQQMKAGMLATGATTTFGDFLACSRFDARPRLASITTPALVIGGAQDRMIPPQFAKSLADGLPRARLALLEGAGHYAMLERPDEVARLVADFINTLGGR